MKGFLTSLLVLQTVMIGITDELDQPQGCEIYNLGDANEEKWSRPEPFPEEILITIRSPKKTWQEFSFGFESTENEAIGLLRFRRDSSINLTLKNWDTNNSGDQEEIQQLSNDFQQKLLLEKWTVISLHRLNDLLTVTVDGAVETEFPKVTVEPFHFIYVHVPIDQYIDVGLNCKKETVGDPPLVEITTSKGNTEPCSPGDGGSTTTIVVVVLLVLIIVAAAAGGGYWYWKKKKLKERQAGYLSKSYKVQKTENKTEEDKAVSSGEAEGAQLLDNTDANLLYTDERQLGIATLYNKEQSECELVINKNEHCLAKEHCSTEHDLTQNVAENLDQPTVENIDDNSQQDKELSPKTLGDEKKIIQNENMDTGTATLSTDEMEDLESQILQDSDIINEMVQQITTDEIVVEITKKLDQNIDQIEIATDTSNAFFLDAIDEKEQRDEAESFNGEEREGNGTTSEEVDGQIQTKAEERPNDVHKDPEAVEEELCQQVIIAKPGENEGAHPDRISEITNEGPPVTEAASSDVDVIENASVDISHVKPQFEESNQAIKDYKDQFGGETYQGHGRENQSFKKSSISRNKEARRDASNLYYNPNRE